MTRVSLVVITPHRWCVAVVAALVAIVLAEGAAR